MGKGDAKRARRQSDIQDRRNQEREDRILGTWMDERPGVMDRDRRERETLTGYYGGGAEHGFVDADQRDRAAGYIDTAIGGLSDYYEGDDRTGGRPGMGPSGEYNYRPGYRPGQLTEAEGQYRNLGNVDMGALREALPGYRDIAERGGFTELGESGIRDSISQLNEIGRTGGFSPEDRIDYRARSNAPIRSMYSSGRRDLDRMEAMQGGRASGGAAARLQLMRDQGQQLADASRGTEAALNQQIIANRMSGLAGSGSMGLDLEGSLVSNRLNALGGVSGTQQGAEALRQAGVGAGAAGLANIGGRRTDWEIGEADRFNEANRYNAARASAAGGRAYDAYQDSIDSRNRWQQYQDDQRINLAGMGMGDAQYWGDASQAGRMGSVGGLHDLYTGGSGGEAARYDDQILRGAGMFGGLGAGTVDQYIAAGHIPGSASAIGQILGGAGGIAGAFAGGGGGRPSGIWEGTPLTGTDVTRPQLRRTDR
jgi:hypothetical protein